MKTDKYFCLSCGRNLFLWAFQLKFRETEPSQSTGERMIAAYCSICRFGVLTGESGKTMVWNDGETTWDRIPEGCLLIASSEEI